MKHALGFPPFVSNFIFLRAKVHRSLVRKPSSAAFCCDHPNGEPTPGCGFMKGADSHNGFIKDNSGSGFMI
jgi:hypothetical protein